MGKYDDYVEMCENDGETPDLYEDWHAKRMAAGRAKAKISTPETEVFQHVAEGMEKSLSAEEVKAHAKADAAQAELEAKIAEMEAKIQALEPEPEVETVMVPMEWGEDGFYRYYSHFSEHCLTYKSERAIGPDGRLITSAHQVIQFADNQYKTSDKKIADWIENEAADLSVGRKEFGWHIFRDTELKKHKVMHVTDGPKMSIPQQQHRYADRPTPLHANA